MRKHKCKYCRKHIGESFKDFPEGTVDTGKDYFCSERCYQKYKKASKKKVRSLKDKCFCGNIKWKTSISCRDCYVKYKRPILMERFAQTSKDGAK